MPRVEEYQLHPFGWEEDPEREVFRLSTLDYLTTITYCNTVVFFKVDKADKGKVVAILKEGLARTLSQVRNHMGRIERDESGGYSIVRKRGDTIKFVVQHLDGPEDKYPSFEELAKAHFTTSALGDIKILNNYPMIPGDRPEAYPDSNPTLTSYKLNFVRGGLILNMQEHHWVNGLTGIIAYRQQIAANCYAIAHGTEFPSFDAQWLDRSSYGVPGYGKRVQHQKKQESEAPQRAGRSTEHRPSQYIVFHLRRSKAEELKKAAQPEDGFRISTYDAVCALLWRVSCRLRQPLYNFEPSYKPLFAEGVSISKLFTNPPLPPQLQGNLQIDINSATSVLPELTLSEIISEVPLSHLASYIRRFTESVTMQMLTDYIGRLENVKNQNDLSINVDSFPPMSMLVSDWRSYPLCNMDFGFGEPQAWRVLFGGDTGVPLSQVACYPPHKGPAGDDEGIEVFLSMEKELVPSLCRDPDWSKYFEFRGIDADEEASPEAPTSKL